MGKTGQSRSPENVFIEFLEKFKTKDNICTAYLIKKSGNNYSFLIPLKLNEASQGYLIANDENGNVKLREVVSFKSNDSDEIL